jgi:hypothetical protein
VKAKLATERISTLTRIDVKGVRDVINNLRIQAAAR